MTGRIIKAGALGDRQLARYNPDDALRSVQAKIDEANLNLRRERELAAAEVQRIYDEAARKGYETGYARGVEEGRASQEAEYRAKLENEVAARSEALRAALEGVASKLDAARSEWLSRWEEAAVEIVCAVASRVARKVVSDDSLAIRRTLREVLSLVSGSSKIVVRLHPDDVDSIRTASNPIDLWEKTRPDVEFVADAEVTRGGCRAETEHCSIDALVETQISKMLAEVAGEAASAGEASDANPPPP
jgi:flagellar assembly protein FliH